MAMPNGDSVCSLGINLFSVRRTNCVLGGAVVTAGAIPFVSRRIHRDRRELQCQHVRNRTFDMLFNHGKVARRQYAFVECDAQEIRPLVMELVKCPSIHSCPIVYRHGFLLFNRNASCPP